MNTQFTQTHTRNTRIMSCWIIGMMLIVMACGASQVRLDVALDKPLVLSEKKQTVYLRVGLTGFELESEADRPPLNVAIVLDHSCSMTGEKIEKAKKAAIMAINRLSSKDILSVVIYDSKVEVVVPATRVSDKVAIIKKIKAIVPGGYTALFAGVSKGAEEVRKFIDEERVNRVILLSDGLANVGPSKPGELAELGESLIKEGISVMTIGLGLDFNEDLMAKLAQRSDGNHYFAETANDLAGVFNKEFGRALSVVAQDTTTKIICPPGIRPVRCLNRDAEIDGQTVSVFINNLYSEYEKYIVMELEVPAATPGSVLEVANVLVSYNNMKTKIRDKLASTASVKFTNSREIVKSKTNPKVSADVVELIAVERHQLAVSLRDQGKVEDARKMLYLNNDYLNSNAAIFNSEKLKNYAIQNTIDAQNLDEENWTRQRKVMQAGDLWMLQQ